MKTRKAKPVPKGWRIMLEGEIIAVGDKVRSINPLKKTYGGWIPVKACIGGPVRLTGAFITKRPVCETCKGKGYILPLYHHPMGARIERCDACKMFSGDLQATVAFFNTPESNGYSLRHIVLNTPAQAVKSSKPSFRIAGVIIGISGLKAFNKAQHKKGGKK